MSGSALKLVMMCLMVFDHIGYFIPFRLQVLFHILTRCVMPFFAYMAVEGFRHTKDLRGYMMRMLIAALVMAAGNFLFNEHIIRSEAFQIRNNIFLTLFLGIVTLSAVSQIKKERRPFHSILYIIAAAAAMALGMLYAEGGKMVIPFMLITYLYHEKKRLRNTLYFLLSAILAAVAYVPYPSIMDTLTMMVMRSDFLFIMVLPFVYLYNGERGNAPRCLSYIFYPVHLWAITLIAWMIP